MLGRHNRTTLKPVSAVHVSRQKRGIGFYSYNQIKNTRPVGRVGAMLIGVIYVLVGIFVILRVISVRKAESLIWGSAEPHAVWFIFGVCLIGIGAFAAHVGMIYYFRKLCRWDSGARRHSK
jgi:hypothetical protein